MRAIVLVGGEGTRLRPLTLRTPKQLVPVVNRPLLEHLLLRLRAHGVTEVTLALMERVEAIRDAFGDGDALGLTIRYSYEDEPLGSGGAIGQAAQGWDERFFVCNGDVITDVDLNAMVDAHVTRNAELSILLHEVEDPTPFGVVDLDDTGRIRRFVEKPPLEEAPSRLINAGVWLFEPSLLPELPSDHFHMVERGLFPDLAAADRPIFGFDDGGAYWRDIGDAELLLAANLELAATAEDASLGRVIDPSAAVDPRATVDGPCVIGAGTSIAAGARVSSSVIWPNVAIEADAVLERCIVASGAQVGAGARLVDVVVAHDAVIAPNEVVSETTITAFPERTPA
jgi:mannose-1-phosphate guanylyltransferase